MQLGFWQVKETEKGLINQNSKSQTHSRNANKEKGWGMGFALGTEHNKKEG